ncbi:uncharacterized protein LOC110102216 [Dendrobium catenatum]|uniref:VQ domain-containing protein n=1 Tax=Dendrobium catenatum TaxID=906689 RepID=A0A2I0WWQ2_9ASPA|nr:uncharacterized protein LOC110102216 [Dendrobium catenatum]PKU80084.1 hypothetical protein MA16_Dca021711 [Dendrobium catenatum]
MNPSPEINGFVRTSPIMKLNKVSTTTITSTSSTSVSSVSYRPPVIIYTQSPKIIHTRACDFMALVQKLTGFSRSSNDDINDNPTTSSSNNDDSIHLNKKRKISVEKKKEELSEPSLDDTLQLTPEQRPSVTPATTNFELNPPLSDVPLFMQGFTTEFFDLPNALYKYTELPGSSPLPNINGATPTFSEI